jgi:Ig-like domain from next to BRCA1 gene
MSKTVQSPRARARTSGASKRQGRRPPRASSPAGAAVIAAAATVTAAVVTGIFTVARPQPGPASTASASASKSPAASAAPLPHSRIPGDKSMFIKDVTFPDNSIVRPGERFIKKWELQNTGVVRWMDRYLVPSGSPTGSCSYPGRVRIPATKPGHTVVISVPVIAESTPGLCFVTWKMVNASGALYFPGYLGIWFEIKISTPARPPYARSGE